MRFIKEDIEIIRDLNRRRLLKLGSVGAFVSIAGASLQPKTATAKDGDPGEPYDDFDIRDGRTGRNRSYSDPVDSDPYNGSDND